MTGGELAEARAETRASQFKRSLVESVPMHSTAEVATLLGISGAAVRKRQITGKLLAVRPTYRWRFPAWQLVSRVSSRHKVTIPGLERVLAAFPMTNPWVQLSLLMAPLDRQEGRNIAELLGTGALDAAVDIIGSYGSHGA